MRMLVVSVLVLIGCTQMVAPSDGANTADGTTSTDAVLVEDAVDRVNDTGSSDSAVCVGEYAACTTRDDCCNRRHSCLRAVCQYSCSDENGFCTRDEQCCNARQVCRSGACAY